MPSAAARAIGRRPSQVAAAGDRATAVSSKGTGKAGRAISHPSKRSAAPPPTTAATMRSWGRDDADDATRSIPLGTRQGPDRLNDHH